MTKKRKVLISAGVVLAAAIVVFALVISRAEWIQTNTEHYLRGQPVTIRFTNPTLRIMDRGSWGIEGVHYITAPSGVVRIVPGQSFTWTWDQTYHVVPDDSRNFTRVPLGTYTVWWEPTDLKTGEPIGRFTYEFEIVAVVPTMLSPALTPAGENGYLCREGLPSVQA